MGTLAATHTRRLDAGSLAHSAATCLQVYCDTPVEQCAAWNKERPAEEQYEEKV